MVALELALKVREMARVAGTGFGLEEILHGPLVSLGRKDHVMLLPTMNEPADKEEKALYLERTKQLIEKIQKTGCSLAL